MYMCHFNFQYLNVLSYIWFIQKAETNLTADQEPKEEEKQEKQNDDQDTSKSEDIASKRPSLMAVTEEYKPSSTVVLIQSSGSFSAKTLPLPNRPLSSSSDVAATECIYDQLPGSLVLKPVEANTMPRQTIVKAPSPILEPADVQENNDEPNTEEGEEVKVSQHWLIWL